jgi:hypothetical protein
MVNKYVIYGVLGFFAYSYYKRQQSEVRIYYVNRLPFNYNGLVVPAVGVFIKKIEKNNQELLSHELTHWEQYRREGLMMLPKYFIEALKNGYDGNSYEIEARKNESEYCQLNYTDCVRRGISITAHNPRFRS